MVHVNNLKLLISLLCLCSVACIALEAIFIAFIYLSPMYIVLFIPHRFNFTSKKSVLWEMLRTALME